MGVRGEIFSNKVILPNRTYFFNVKENRMGDLYLNIVESKNRESGGFDRQSVILFADDLQEFLKGFDESLRVLEKSVRDKRKTGGDDKGGKQKQRQGSGDERDDRPNQHMSFRGERDRYPKQRQGFGGERDGRQKQRRGFSGGRDGYAKQDKQFGGGGGYPKQRKDFNSENAERKPRGHNNDHGSGKNRRVIVKKHKK